MGSPSRFALHLWKGPRRTGFVARTSEIPNKKYVRVAFGVGRCRPLRRLFDRMAERRHLEVALMLCAYELVSDRTAAIRNRIRKLSTAAAPEPWVALPIQAVGGLAAVGFASGSNVLLVLSSGGGRSLYDVGTGERIARDRNGVVSEWLSADGVTARGIGPVEDEDVRVAGLWGGGLAAATADGWSCNVVAPDWPTERVVLQPPGADVLFKEFAAGCVQIADSAVVELRAAGFSADGKALVVATSADVSLWVR